MTRHYHLTHCAHPPPGAILAGLLMLIMAFVAFEVFAQIHCKLLRLGRITLQELARMLDRSIERWEDLQPRWSG